MKDFLYLIVCAIVVGSQAIEDEPKINFGICDPELENLRGTRILSFFNDPEHADFRELLRPLRCIMNYKFDEKDVEKRLRDFTEKLFGKSKMSNQISELIETRREKNKHMVLCTIDIILGDKETRGAFTLELAVQELFRKLRDIIKNREFDVEIIRDILEESFEIEMDDQFFELIKITGEIGKPMLLYFINVYILKEKTQGDRAQQADIQNHLRKLRDIIKNYKFEEEKIQDFIQKHLELGKSEMTDHLSGLIKITGQMGKQRLSDLINKILGDKETQGDCASQKTDIKELKKLRDRIQNRKFDEGNFFRNFTEKVLGKSEVANHFHGLLATSGERGKQRIVNFINKILENQETQGTCSVQHSDSNAARLKKRLENLISRMKHNLDTGEGVGEHNLLMKKATAVYEKLQNLGLELDDNFKQMFEDLSKVDQSSSVQQADFNRMKKRLEYLAIDLKHNLDSGEGGEFYLRMLKKLTPVLERMQMYEDLSKFDPSSLSKAERKRGIWVKSSSRIKMNSGDDVLDKARDLLQKKRAEKDI